MGKDEDTLTLQRCSK